MGKLATVRIILALLTVGALVAAVLIPMYTITINGCETQLMYFKIKGCCQSVCQTIDTSDLYDRQGCGSYTKPMFLAVKWGTIAGAALGAVALVLAFVSCGASGAGTLSGFFFVLTFLVGTAAGALQIAIFFMKTCESPMSFKDAGYSLNASPFLCFGAAFFSLLEMVASCCIKERRSVAYDDHTGHTSHQRFL